MGQVNVPEMLELLPPLLRGLWVTLLLTVCGGLLAIALAFAAGIARRSEHLLVRLPAAVYVEVFRGTSALVQLFWFYFALPLMGVHLPAFAAGVLVLGLNTGAYGAEVVRGALRAVPRGQSEAAVALNLSPRQRMWLVIVPQAALSMLPPWGNLLIELLKNTALVSLITINDLTFQAQLLRADTLRTVEIFLLVLLLYFGAALCITAGVRTLERRCRVGLGEAPSP